MWKILVALFLFILIIAAVSVGISVGPHYYYEKIITGQYQSKWFQLQKQHKNFFLRPMRYPFQNIDNISADNLWKEFQVADVQIPLPYKHPFFQIIPLINFNNESLDLGLSFKDMTNKELARVHFMKNILFNTSISGSELFNLPISKEILSKVSRQIIWADVFSKDITKLDIDYQEMIYNLYLLQLRDKFFHPKTESFGHIGQQDIGIIVLANEDKDFNTELIMTLRNGMIYSYILFTRRYSPEADELRDRFLNKVKFIRGDNNISKINYNEFKILDYTKKIKQEGLVYLFSSWSNWEEDKKEQLLKEIIFYSERGNLESHLNVFYDYAMKKYGKSLSSLDSRLIKDPKLRLARKMEEEEEYKNQKAKAEEEAALKKPVYVPVIEDVKSKLKKAKEIKKKSKRSNRNTISD